MSAVQGILTLANANTSDLVGEFQESIYIRNSKGFNTGSTLFGLMAKLKNEQAENIEFNWWERNPVRRTIYSTAAKTAGDTTLSFDDNASTPDTTVWKLLVDGHILRNARTGEYVRVSGTPTTTTVTIVRAVAGFVAAAAINDNDVWTIVTLAKAEGADPVKASYEEPELLKNYIQTFNSTVELTNAFKGSVLRTDIEGPLRDRRLQALEKVSRDIELAYLLGIKATSSDTGSPGYMTGGLFQSLSAAGLSGAAGSGYNSVDGGSGTFTIANFRDWLNSFMVVGSEQKLAFCGPSAYQAITVYANTATNGFRIMQNESVFGMNITSILTPFGVLDLAMHPILRECVSLNSWMFVFDLQHIVQKVFEPLFLEPNVQTPGNDSYKEQYRAKLGLKLRYINAHGCIKNLTAIQ
jgi:hypothetical protein